MNKVILMGRLTNEPDVRDAGNTTVARFNIAVDRKFKQDGGQAADFPSIVAFGKTAEFISKYFHKGMKILLEGRIQTGSYEKDGVKHYTTDVIAEAVEFAESKKAEDNPPPSSEGNGFVNFEDIDEELPFK